jgi:hypothetical protein
MHARHYSPALGRFIQPDPAAAESNLYGYAGNNPIGVIDPRGYLGGSINPNPAELARCATHWYECLVWAYAGARAIAITNLRYGDVRIRNAMRHCMWQCMLTDTLGWSRAQIWANLHETGSNPNDTHVDYHNNYVGRLLGEHLDELSYPSQTIKALVLCAGAWNWGYLWYVNPGPAFYMSNGTRISTARAYQSGPNSP